MPTMASPLREVVKNRGIFHQDVAPRRLIGRPFGEQVEQDRIVRLLVGRLGWVRPVAAQTSRCGAAWT